VQSAVSASTAEDRSPPVETVTGIIVRSVLSVRAGFCLLVNPDPSRSLLFSPSLMALSGIERSEFGRGSPESLESFTLWMEGSGSLGNHALTERLQTLVTTSVYQMEALPLY
jgi:hypothetical protein